MNAAVAPRTRALLEGPIAPTLLRMALPNVLVMVAQASAGLIETWFIGKLGTDALAGVALVFPVLMMMQMMSAGAMGGGIASSIARALGGRRKADADALAVHALLLAIGFSLVFSAGLLLSGAPLYRTMGGEGGSLAAALIYSDWIFAGALVVWLFNSLAAVVRGTGINQDGKTSGLTAPSATSPSRGVHTSSAAPTSASRSARGRGPVTRPSRSRSSRRSASDGSGDWSS